MVSGGEEMENESAHPTPNVLRAWHLAQFSTSVSPKKEVGGCGGRRSLERVEHRKERDEGEDGVLYHAYDPKYRLAPNFQT